MELESLAASSTAKSNDIKELITRHDELQQTLSMRERQLALCVTHLEAGKTESDVLRTKGTVEEGRLRQTLDQREAQLVRLVRELYELATAERVPGVVAHDARSRVFRRCAIVYEQIGEDAFRQAEEEEELSRRAASSSGAEELERSGLPAASQ